MRDQQSGFTLIELIAVIIILAIIALAAVPKFIDFTSGSQQSALDGVAGNLGSAMIMNYASALAQHAGVVGATHLPVDNCDDGVSLISGNIPAGYVVTANPVASLGLYATCDLSANGKTAQFEAIGAP